MNKRGQALVEFVLILPVLLLIVISMIDVGNIFLKKYELNNNLDTITEMYQNGEMKQIYLLTSSEDIKLEEKTGDNMTKLTVKKNVSIQAPILSNILGKTYEISLSKIVYNYEGINGE